MSSSSSSSSTTDSSDLDEKFDLLNIANEQEINILLLGETGVGKSTFINSLANYLCLKYFNEAEKKGLIKLIPTIYKIRDKNGKDHEIKIGPKRDENEYLVTGESATQNVKTYVFPVWKGRVKVRIIDTPGMGDTRGVDQDESNCENIIKYILKIEKIHAICFLCKPTNARKTIYFDYCVYQILSHLEKDAARNIFFLFTNTRGSDYSTGDTLPILKAIAEEVKDSSGVDIPLEKNIYCFDNEGFRFLGACEKKVQFDDSTRKKYFESWQHSAKECWRFIRYLQTDIKPYVPIKLLEVNFSKKLLLNFSKVLVELKELMADNQCIIDKMEEKRNSEKDSIRQLRDQKTKVTDVIKTKMSQPMLACTSSPSCAEIYKIKGVDKWHFKRICHQCYELSSDVRTDIVGCIDIIKCHAIDKPSRKCNQCGCDFLLHVHIDFLTSLKEDLLVDDDITHRIATSKSVMDNYKEIVDDVQYQIAQNKSEYDVIKNICCNLSIYLMNYAIIGCSNSYKEYIDYLINQIQISGATNINTSVDKLKKLKEEYLEAEIAFKQPLRPKADLNFDMKEDQFLHVFGLKQNGKKLRDMYYYLKISSSTSCDFKEYVHDKYYIKEHDRKKNNRGREYTKDKHRGTIGKFQHQNSSNYPDRPDSRNSTSSYHSRHQDSRNDFPPYRPDFNPGYSQHPHGGYYPPGYQHPPNYNYPANPPHYGQHPPHGPPYFGQHHPVFAQPVPPPVEFPQATYQGYQGNSNNSQYEGSQDFPKRRFQRNGERENINKRRDNREAKGYRNFDDDNSSNYGDRRSDGRGNKQRGRVYHNDDRDNDRNKRGRSATREERFDGNRDNGNRNRRAGSGTREERFGGSRNNPRNENNNRGRSGSRGRKSKKEGWVML